VIIDLIRNDDGVPIGFAKITRDVSERRAADLRLRDLTKANQDLEQFVHIASHDLREPLRKVLAFSDLLVEEEGAKLSSQALDYLRSITSSTQRMQSLLASLLDLTRVTSQGQPFDPCPLNQVLSEVCSDLEIAIDESAAQVQVGELPQIEADAAQMRQLFQNLIENAVKYAQDGVAARIDIRAQPDPDSGFITITVADNGIGFEPEYQERIFGVFQRLHTRDRYGGAGIGLAICRKICTRHGGEISARAKPLQGAVFTVRLPRRHATHDR
jgi:light-regulated signal transduction histidine kinase (bacteriophytochrome)